MRETSRTPRRGDAGSAGRLPFRSVRNGDVSSAASRDGFTAFRNGSLPAELARDNVKRSLMEI